MKSKIELLPCPFCGGEAEVAAHGIHEGRFIVRCLTAKCNRTYRTEVEAIAAWNTRPSVVLTVDEYDAKALMLELAARRYALECQKSKCWTERITFLTRLIATITAQLEQKGDKCKTCGGEGRLFPPNSKRSRLCLSCDGTGKGVGK